MITKLEEDGARKDRLASKSEALTGECFGFYRTSRFAGGSNSGAGFSPSRRLPDFRMLAANSCYYEADFLIGDLRREYLLERFQALISIIL